MFIFRMILICKSDGASVVYSNVMSNILKVFYMQGNTTLYFDHLIVVGDEHVSQPVERQKPALL